MTRDMMGGMAKRSAAMSQACLLKAHNMPAPDLVGLGHGTLNWMVSIIRDVMGH